LSAQRDGDFGVEASRKLDRAWFFALLMALILVGGCRKIESLPDLLNSSTLVPTYTASATPGTPLPTFTYTPMPTATPTITPTPTPTPTPIPPVRLSIEFPKPVTALEPVTWRVLIEEPPGIDAHVRARARVIDAKDQLYAKFDMVPEGRDGWWVPVGALQLPLEPEPYPGIWHLVIDAETDLRIRGYRDRVFTPQWVPYHVLTATLPSGVELHLPQAFAEVAAQGDRIAGLHTWNYRDCEVTLAWAPGPTEPLLSDNARVLVEATYPTDSPQYEISLDEGEEMTWGEEEWTTFLFRERWKGQNKSTPAETLVVQGPNYRLYALRIRAQNEDKIHPLCQDVRNTFRFVEEG
jgi:hypothetical protein